MDLYVSGKFKRLFKLTDSGDLRCCTCERIKCGKSDIGFIPRARRDDDFSAVIPLVITKPHTCLFSTLKLVNDLFSRKLIPAELCDKWMSANSENYQLGNSEQCMKLWDELNTYKCSRFQSSHYSTLDWSKEKGAVELGKCSDHKGFYVKIIWSRIKSKADLKLLNEIWRWSSDADHAKTNVSAADLIWHMNSRDWCRALYDRWRRLFSVNLYNVTACSLLIHLVGNPSSGQVFRLLEERKLCCLDIDDFKAVFKAISIAIRRTGHWPCGREATLEEVTNCAAWELATGRSMNKSDWDEERRKRTTVKIPLGDPTDPIKNEETNKEYIADLKEVLAEIMGELVGKPTCRDSWPDYVENRQSWCSSGSTGGKKFKLSTDESVRLNKHAYFEIVTKEEMVGWLDSEPEIVASASEKFEMGKARAIYGTQPIDYSISSYVLDNIESRMYNVEGVESGLVGQDFIATMIRRCAAVEQPGTECTMIDYADFNYQHTLEAQHAVFEALSEAMRRKNYHPDKIKACDWTAKAMLNQWCWFPGPDRQKVRVTQGMFSGCRGTNFLNTILNVAYFRLACKWVRLYLGLRPVNLHNIHQGDDVWISNLSRLWAIAMYDIMKSMGFVFQPSKQMFDICRGEFLRVVYTLLGCKGYLGRAIATLIMKPIQGTEVTSPAERAVALNSQIMILKRRGMTDRACELIWDAVVPFAARAKLPNGALTIPVSYLTKSYLDGGLDLGYPGTAAERSEVVAPIPVMSLGSAILEREIPDNMAKDWVNVLSRKLRTDIKYDDLVETMHKSNVTDSLRTEDRISSLRKLEKSLREWLSNLQCGSVQRNRALYEALVEGPKAEGSFGLFIRDMCKNLLRKRSSPEFGLMDTIMRAIGSSPFKSLNNTMIATGLGAVAASEAAIMSCPNHMLKVTGISAVNRIKYACGEDVYRALLDGIRAGATKYEAEFHPTLLSWVQCRSLNVTVERALASGERCVNKLKELVAADFDAHVRAVREKEKLVGISKY
nr:MAG: putative RNA dependent RNA polymerase [Hattula totivirus 2]